MKFVVRGLDFVTAEARSVAIEATDAEEAKRLARQQGIVASFVGEDVLRCPKCASSGVAPEQKGFSVGKAMIGAALLGPAGVVGGFVGSSKVALRCMNCGHAWKPG